MLSGTPKSNVIQMSEKCWKRRLSKNEDTKAVRHFEENDYQEPARKPQKIRLVCSTLMSD